MTKHYYKEAYDEAFARGFKKAEAEFTSEGGPAYVNWLHFAHLKRKEQQDLYNQADKMAKFRKGVINIYHHKGNKTILDNSNNFRDDIMSGFKQMHPKADIYAGSSYQLSNDHNNLNSQTVAIHDNTEEHKFIKELLKKKLNEYHKKNFVSKMFSKKPNEAAMLNYSPEEVAELSRREKAHDSAHFYTVTNPDSDKTELKKLFEAMAKYPHDRSHIY